MTPVSAEAKASAQLLANLMKLLQSSPPSLIQHLSQQAISWLLSAIRLDVFLWGCMRLHGDTVTDRARLQRVLQGQATTQQQRFWRKCHVRASSQECLHETAQLQKSFSSSSAAVYWIRRTKRSWIHVDILCHFKQKWRERERQRGSRLSLIRPEMRHSALDLVFSLRIRVQHMSPHETNLQTKQELSHVFLMPPAKHWSKTHRKYFPLVYLWIWSF